MSCSKGLPSPSAASTLLTSRTKGRQAPLCHPLLPPHQPGRQPRTRALYEVPDPFSSRLRRWRAPVPASAATSCPRARRASSPRRCCVRCSAGLPPAWQSARGLLGCPLGVGEVSVEDRSAQTASGSARLACASSGTDLNLLRGGMAATK